MSRYLYVYLTTSILAAIFFVDENYEASSAYLMVGFITTYIISKRDDVEFRRFLDRYF
jgi:hypothetical protein